MNNEACKTKIREPQPPVITSGSIFTVLYLYPPADKKFSTNSR